MCSTLGIKLFKYILFKYIQACCAGRDFKEKLSYILIKSCDYCIQ